MDAADLTKLAAYVGIISNLFVALYLYFRTRHDQHTKDLAERHQQWRDELQTKVGDLSKEVRDCREAIRRVEEKSGVQPFNFPSY